MYEIFMRLCELNGITPADVSRATKIRESTLSNWKSRGSMLSAKNAKIIAEYFGVSVDYLMTGKDTPKESTSGKKYYFSDETAAIAQEVFKNPELKMLFSAARDVSPDKIKAVADMVLSFKETNPDG